MGVDQLPVTMRGPECCYVFFYYKDYPWGSKKIYMYAMYNKLSIYIYSLCKNITSNFSLDILSYMHDIAIPTKDM